MSEELTVKEQKFIKYWTETGNGTEAVKRAGYQVINDNVAANLAWRLLRKAKIVETVADELAIVGITPEYRYLKLREILEKGSYPEVLKALRMLWELEGRIGVIKAVAATSSDKMAIEFIEMKREEYGLE